MKKFVVGLVLVALVAVAGYAAFWWFDLRWRPKEITENRAQIERALDQAGWVSPRLNGPRLYMVSFRDCPNCIRYEREQFPVLQRAGVDTRVIMFVRDQEEGGPETSTIYERSTVAELWLNRDWTLFQRWMRANPPSAWTAPGLPIADTDRARSAIVDESRRLVDQLEGLLDSNGVDWATPMLVWRTQDGRLRACACFDERSWRHVRADLGADS